MFNGNTSRDNDAVLCNVQEPSMQPFKAAYSEVSTIQNQVHTFDCSVIVVQRAIHKHVNIG